MSEHDCNFVKAALNHVPLRILVVVVVHPYQVLVVVVHSYQVLRIKPYQVVVVKKEENFAYVKIVVVFLKSIIVNQISYYLLYVVLYMKTVYQSHICHKQRLPLYCEFVLTLYFQTHCTTTLLLLSST